MQTMFSEPQIHYVVPRGTTTGMSAFINHFNEQLFPDSEKYELKLWIDAESKPNDEMEGYIMSFSNKPRQFISMQ